MYESGRVQFHGNRRSKVKRRKSKITRTVIKSPGQKKWEATKRKWKPRIVNAFAFIGAVMVIVFAMKELL